MTMIILLTPEDTPIIGEFLKILLKYGIQKEIHKENLKEKEKV